MPHTLALVLGYLYLLVPGLWMGLWFHNVVVCWFHRSLLKRALHDLDLLFMVGVMVLPIALCRVPAMRRLLLWQPANPAERAVLVALGVVWIVALVFQGITSWRLLRPAPVPHLRGRRTHPAPYRGAPGDGPWEIHGQTARADCLAFADTWTGERPAPFVVPASAGPPPTFVVPASAGKGTPRSTLAAPSAEEVVARGSAGQAPPPPDRPPRPMEPPNLLARLPMQFPIRRWNHVFDLDLVEIALEFATLPPAFDGLRVLQISDIHLGIEMPAGYYRHLFETAGAAGADLIVITGDFTAHDHLHREAVALCAQLRAPLGVWAVRGNHDFYTEPGILAWWLARAGIGLLSNRAVDIVADVPGPRQVLRLTGIEHPHLAVSDWRGLLDAPAEEERLWTPREATEPPPPPERERLARIAGLRPAANKHASETLALPACERDARAPEEAAPFHLVLSHRPDYVRELAPAGADLVLAGHTHGGQWRLPLVGAFVLPSLYGRLYAEGFRTLGSTLLYTSRGAGVHTVPFRYRCPPEVTLFTLHRPRAMRAGNAPR